MKKIFSHTKIQRLSLKEVPSFVDDLNNNEFVLLDRDNGFFCGMNTTAKQIWAFLETPKTLGEIFDYLKSRFHFDNDSFKDEVLAFITDLQHKKMVKIL